MNFFESQDRVRKNTTLLVGLFVVAVVALILMANLLVMIVFGFIGTEQLRSGSTFFAQMDWKTFAAVGAGVVVVVVGGSLYKLMALSAGGKVVAESLGGRLIPRNTENLNELKLLNVVEEMAIASGTPAPPVYLLTEEKGINAFAAGFSSRDAVLGITQGAVDHLSREQLQGVIAHEFSHIFNGDMRLNIRLMGALNGILILGILGYYLLYSASFSGRRRSKDNGAAAMLALAIGLMVIGFAGTFFGGLIKAAVSRQREYMADASAVQFTRNPNGIAGALKRIGGLEFGSKLDNPGAAEASHAFFAQGVSGFMQWLSATHPPLRDRILRIDPQWDGQFTRSDPPEPASTGQEKSLQARRATPQEVIAAVAAGSVIADAALATERVGQPTEEAVAYARSLLSELPGAIEEAVREPYGARAVIYCVALDKGQAIRGRQLKRLQDFADPDVHALTLHLIPLMDGLDTVLRLPIIDLAIPTLKQLSLAQYELFKTNLLALIELDAKLELLEWSLQKIVLNHLDGHFFSPKSAKVRYSDPLTLRTEIEVVLSVMARAGAKDGGEAAAAAAFAASLQAWPAIDLKLLPSERIAIVDLDRAFVKLEQSTPSVKAGLLKACGASIWHDEKATPLEVELLRAFASALDCPMPPVAASAMKAPVENKASKAP